MLLVPSCKQGKRNLETSPSPTTVSTVTALGKLPVDHLALGELQASPSLAFGFPIPTTMSVERSFPNAVHLVGVVETQELVRYVRANAQTHGIELQGNALVFDQVRFKGGEPTRIFRIEITSQGRSTRMLIKDETPQSLPNESGLTDDERWRRAGMKPNGEPLDISRLQ
jgi:hypothetical protein